MLKAFHSIGMLAPVDSNASHWICLWVVDHSWFTQASVMHEKRSSVAVLYTPTPVRLAPITIHRSKALNFCLAHSPSEWLPTTIHVSVVSRIENPYLTCLLPFIYTDWSRFNKWCRFNTWSVYAMERAVPNVLYTQCMFSLSIGISIWSPNST